MSEESACHMRSAGIDILESSMNNPSNTPKLHKIIHTTSAETVPSEKRRVTPLRSEATIRVNKASDFKKRAGRRHCFGAMMKLNTSKWIRS